MKITQKRLKEVLRYDPDTGVFTWLVTIPNIKGVGAVAGTIKSTGYIRIGINKRQYYAHRLAFLYMSGELPFDHTDHINGIRHDNRWCNLRAVTEKENHKNKRKRSDNKSGVTGVSWDGRLNKWVVQLGLDRMRVFIQSFDDMQDAIDARKLAEKKYGFHENHGRSY